MTNIPEPISIIIPCRNEESNISLCLDSVLKQTYTNYEIIVIDDMSTDKTSQIIDNYVKKYNFITKISIKNKPEDWVGKNFAVYEGYKHSRNSLILFIDADVCLNNKCLEKVLTYLNKYNLDIISLAAFQECKSISEKSIQPLIFYILNIIYPFDKKELINMTGNACNGIFILCKREAYEEIGTHRIIKNKVLEDVAFAQMAKNLNKKVGFKYAPELISVRMYKNIKEIISGWSKNFFALLNYSILKSIILISIIILLFYLPLILYITGYYSSKIILFWLTLFILHYCYKCFKMKYNWWIGLLFPVGGIILIIIIINSIINYKLKGTIKWKNRQIKI